MLTVPVDTVEFLFKPLKIVIITVVVQACHRETFKVLWRTVKDKTMRFSLIWLLIASLGQAYLEAAMGFCYPVASVNQDSFLLIYQKSLGDLELWRYFPATKELNKCLDWRFVPLGLKVLPDQSGFSFVDAGRLRIKRFIMRSPKTIDFDLPVYGVSELNWLDLQTCYFSAKQHGDSDYFAIFKGDVTKTHLVCWYQWPESDCLCPVVLDQQLFYVARDGHDRATQIRVLDLTQRRLSPELILNCNFQQIINLQMLNSTSGFYVEHMPYLREEIGLVSFICHVFSKTKNWQEIGQFKFQIPRHYLLGEERAQESIGIFLPRVQKTLLYFADFKQNQFGITTTSINSYDLITGKIQQILEASPGETIFAPLIYQDRLYYGKILKQELDSESLISTGIGQVIKR